MGIHVLVGDIRKSTFLMGASRMVAEAEPFELLINVSTAAWLIKDKDLLAKDYGINIEKIY